MQGTWRTICSPTEDWPPDAELWHQVELPTWSGAQLGLMVWAGEEDAVPEAFHPGGLGLGVPATDTSWATSVYSGLWWANPSVLAVSSQVIACTPSLAYGHPQDLLFC